MFGRISALAGTRSAPLCSWRQISQYSKSSAKFNVRAAGSKPSKGEKGKHSDNPFSEDSQVSSELEEIERSLRRKQLVINNYDIPGKYQKFFTGRLRKRETKRLERQLDSTADGEVEDLRRVSSRTVTIDEQAHERRRQLLRSHILRILESHLASDQLPVRQLSLQYWEITDVIVSFNMKTAICCYKITSPPKDELVKPFQIRRIVQESSDYLNAVINQELAKRSSRSSKGPKSVNIKFRNSTATARLLDRIQSDVQLSEKHPSKESNSE